jgi:hypothetical protein
MAWMSCVSGSRRRGLSVRAAAVFCLALAAFVSPPVLTAHVELMSVSEIVAASPHIVVATVEGRQSRWNGLHTLILTDYTLHVEERLRGTAPDRLSITVPGGTLGKISDDTCVSVRLQPGARYLLFLDEIDHPTFVPVVGAEQGIFRELRREVRREVASFAAAGSSSEPLRLNGAPVTFHDFVGAVRSLAARTPLVPRPAPAAAAVALPAKTWSPAAPPAPLAGSLPPRAAPQAWMPPLPGAGAPGNVEITEITAAVSTLPRPVSLATDKFLYHELAARPVVINPLAGSPFSPWDEYEMAYWNLYAGDLFRVSDSPTSSWAYRNGVSDIVGFPDDQTMKRQFGYGWSDLGQGVLAVTFARREEGVVIEADVAFNPQKRWTIDDLAATSGQESVYAFKEVVLHELGHVWGLLHPWDEEEWVRWDSVMNYKPRTFYVAELFADDTAAVRRAFPRGAPIRDGLINSYVTVRSEILVIPNYQTALPSLSTVRAGGAFGLTGPIKIENVGTVALANPQVEVYLTPERLSFDGAVLVQRAKIRGKIQPGRTLQVKLSGFRVPRGTPTGVYYLAYFLRDPKDAYQDNNAAWGQDGSTVTVE